MSRRRSARASRAIRPVLATGSIAVGLSCGAAGHAPSAPGAMDAPAPAAMAGPAEAPPQNRALMAEIAQAINVDFNVQQVAGEAVAGLEAPMPGGYAPVRRFPVPDYSQPYDGPRTDFRETVYWDPSVRTNAQGRAEVRFYLSDAVTSFRARAQGIGAGGKPGLGDSLVASKRPVSINARLPLEVSRGDQIELPVTFENATKRAQAARVQASFGRAFRAGEGGPSGELRLGPGERKTAYYKLEVVGAGAVEADGTMEISASASNLNDAVRRVVRVVPVGFPGEASAGGSLRQRATVELTLPSIVPDTLAAALSFYPAPTTQLIAGTEAMVREPSGCFEQASSSNYPNVMVLGYLREQKVAAPDFEARARAHLDRGYGLLTGYESDTKGFEWFGEDPGHEALSAYGVMQFTDMAKVYEEVDPELVQRTVAWLKSRRDGKGGYQRNPKALDSFGQASPEVTNAYITYALTEAGVKDLDAEIAWSKQLAGSTKDPYLLALAAGTLGNVDPGGAATKAALDRLAGMQGQDGRFGGAAESITRSGGQSLDVETTSLAVIALMKAKGAYSAQVQKAVTWIQSQNSGGMFGSTQGTVLALKALTRAAEQSRALPPGTIRVRVNGGAPRTISVGPNSTEAVDVPGLAQDLRSGRNTVEIEASADMNGLPFSLDVDYATERPASSPQAGVAVAVTPAKKSVKNGESLAVQVVVENTTDQGLPMVVARIGVPGGLTHQKWQLDELVKKHGVDYYETREREVIAYFRAMGPREKKRFDLNLMASVPGTFKAPASSAYRYYTDEHRHYAEPVVVTVTR